MEGESGRICGFGVRKGCFIFFLGRPRARADRVGMMARAINALRSKIVPIIADILAVLANSVGRLLAPISGT